MQTLFWTVLGVEAAVAGWTAAQAVRAMRAGLDAGGEASLALAMAAALGLALALNAAVFRRYADRVVRRMALGALLVPAVVPAARMLL